MSVMVIDYGAISDATSTATRLADIFESKKENFEHLVSNIKLVPTSRSNLANANECINKKNIQYQSKIDKLNLFGTKMSQFSQKAQKTDQRVASRITTDTKAFEKEKGIKVSRLAVILDAVKTDGISILSNVILGGKGLSQKEIRSLKDGIKDWYRQGGNRYLIGVAKDVLAVVAIVAVVLLAMPTGGLSLAALGPLLGATLGAQLCTGFELFKGASSMGYDIAALANYKSTGNATGSRWLDKKGGSDVLAVAGGGLGYAGGYLFGGEEGANAGKKGGEKYGKITFSTLSVATLAYGAVKTPLGLSKDFKALKKMGMYKELSNVGLMKKVAQKKIFCKDLKAGFGAAGIDKNFSISKLISPKFGSSNKFKFNAAVNVT
ncbi:hypothetical protein KPL44_12495, partial [Clostridium sp. DSM 17811]